MKNVIVGIVLAFACTLAACGTEVSSAYQQRAQADSGVRKMTATVQTDADGYTIEQKNVAARLANDNKPGAIKYLYVVSPYSGEVILFSSVKGKVTSSGKRLTPNTVAALDGQYVGTDHAGMPATINGRTKATSEVLQDDGTYGNSDPYIFWFDQRGVYHQHFMTGGQIIHVSDKPLRVNKVGINLEQQAD